MRIAYDAMSYSSRTLILFGSLPFVYYIFDYSTVVYSNALYSGIPAITEFIPTILILFYIVFLASYHNQNQKRIQAELYSSVMESELKQSEAQIEGLRQIDNQTTIYQHNMRHHLAAIAAYLSSGEKEQAEEYIKKVQSDIDYITPKRFCANKLVNLLCSSFSEKAEKQNISLTVKANLPSKLSVSDTELCTVISNGLENALHAVSVIEQDNKWIEFYSDVNSSKLLIEIKNPYVGELAMNDGLPVSKHIETGHGYGCRSICSIAERNGGLCSFEAEHGIFTLRVVLPLKNAE